MILINDDSFGDDVFNKLRTQTDCTAMSFQEAADCDWGTTDADYVTIVAGRNHPQFFDRITNALWDAGVDHSIVYLTNRLFLATERISPGISPCYQCFDTRYLVNLEVPLTNKVESIYRNFCESHPEYQQRGHTATMVALAVKRINHYVQGNPKATNKIMVFCFVDNSIIESKIIPVHGCKCRGESEKVFASPIDKIKDYLND